MARKIALAILVAFAASGLLLFLYRDLVHSSHGFVASLEYQDGQAALGPTWNAPVFCSASGNPVEAASQTGPSNGRWQTQHLEAASRPGLEALFEGDPFPDAGGSEPQGLMAFRDGDILDSWLLMNRDPGFRPLARRVSSTGQPPADAPRPDGAGSSRTNPAGGSSQDNVRSSDTQ